MATGPNRRRSTDRWLRRLGEIPEVGTPSRAATHSSSLEAMNTSGNLEVDFDDDVAARKELEGHRQRRSSPAGPDEPRTPMDRKSRREQFDEWRTPPQQRYDGQFSPIINNNRRVDIHLNRSPQIAITHDRSPIRLYDRLERCARPIRFQSSPPILNRRPAQLPIPTFNGRTSFKTFIVKFMDASKFHGWNQEEQALFLRNALVQDAEAALIDMPSDCTTQEIINILKVRYDSQSDSERYRNELRVLKQGRSETIQQLYTRTLDLKAKAFVTDSNHPLVDMMCCDCFIAALVNHQIKTRILEQNVKTLTEAFTLALRLENIYSNTNADRRDIRNLNAADEGSRESRGQIRSLERQLSELKVQLSKALNRKPIEEQQFGYLGPAPSNFASQNTQVCRPAVTNNTSVAAAENWPTNRNRDTYQARGRQCFECGSFQHLKRNCPSIVQDKASGKNDNNRLLEIKLEPLGNHAYLPVVAYRGSRRIPISMLLDSGSNANILTEKFTSLCKSHVRPSNTAVTSATGQQLCIVGEADLSFEVDGIKYCERFLISPSVSDCILSIKFLQKNAIVWHFDRNVVVAQGREISLKQVSEKACVRKICAVEDTVIPAQCEMCIPVNALFNRMTDRKLNYLSEVNRVRDAIVTARALLSDKIESSLIVCNITPRDFCIRKNMVLSTAVRNVEVVEQNRTRTHCTIMSCRTNALFAYKPCDGKSQHSDRVNVLDDAYYQSSEGCDLYSASASERRANADHLPAGRVNVMPRDCDVVENPSVNARHKMTPAEISFKRKEIIEHLMNTLDASISAETRESTRGILERNVDLFALHEYDVGRCTFYKHKIGIKPECQHLRPVNTKLRHYSRRTEEMVDEHIDRLLEAGIIKVSNSDYGLAVVPVAKTRSSDGKTVTSIRLALDARELNKRIKYQTNALPCMEKSIQCLAGKKFYAQFDFLLSFYQVPLTEDSYRYVTFKSHRDSYSYTVMPFGIIDASSVFSRVAAKTFEKLPKYSHLLYIDDCILAGETEEKLVTLLTQFFDCVREAGLKLKHTKCSLFKTEISVLGRRISNGTIQQTPERTEALRRLTLPTTTKAVRRFLGSINFCRIHHPNFAKLVEPFQKLTRKNARVIITPELESAFKEIIDTLCSPQNIHIFDYSLPTFIQTDSSEEYYAAIIWQLSKEGEKRITHYFSHKWSPSQARKCINIKELLAIYYTIRRAESILFGLEFTVLCDNQAAVSFLKTQNLSPQMSRVAEYLGSHRVTFSKMKGTDAAWADLLSRDAPSSETECKSICTLDSPCKECVKFSVSVCTLHADNCVDLNICVNDSTRINRPSLRDFSHSKNAKHKKLQNHTHTGNSHSRTFTNGQANALQQQCGDVTKFSRTHRLPTTENLSGDRTPGDGPGDGPPTTKTVGTLIDRSTGQTGRETISGQKLTVDSPPPLRPDRTEAADTQLTPNMPNLQLNDCTQNLDNDFAPTVNHPRSQAGDHPGVIDQSLQPQQLSAGNFEITHVDTGARTVPDLAVNIVGTNQLDQDGTRASADVNNNEGGLDDARHACQVRARSTGRRRRRKRSRNQTLGVTVGGGNCDVTAQQQQPPSLTDVQPLMHDVRPMETERTQGAEPTIHAHTLSLTHSHVGNNYTTENKHACDTLNNIFELFKEKETEQASVPEMRVNSLTRRQTANTRLNPSQPSVIPINTQADYSADSIKLMQTSDPVICKVMAHVAAGTKPTKAQIGSDSIYRIYSHQLESLTLVEGILYRKFKNAYAETTNYQLVAPVEMRSEIIKRAHIQNLCHAKSKDKNYAEVGRLVWFPLWRQAVDLELQKCTNCAQAPVSFAPPKVAKISNKTWENAPGQKLVYDIFVPAHESCGRKVVLVCVDNFSKYVWLFGLKQHRAEDVCKCLTKLFCETGIYRHLHSDSAPEFTSKTMQLLLAQFGVAHTTSLYYTSRQNGLAEKTNQTIQRLMGRILEKNRDWYNLLNFVAFCYNNTVSQSTGYTPAFLHYGRQVQTMQDLLLASPEELKRRTHGEFAAEVTERMQRVFEQVSVALKRTAELNAKRYNAFLDPPTYQEGEKVFVYSYRIAKQKKFARAFRTQARILKRINENTYSVTIQGKKNPLILSVDKIKRDPSNEPQGE